MASIPCPVNLNSGAQIVWKAWCSKGDREVVRESVSKGQHIKLACKFLAQRKQWEVDEAERWFEAEVRSWALHLLQQRIVFKAAHILKNIDVRPEKEFLKILMETRDVGLASFLFDHLLAKSHEINEIILNDWNLFASLNMSKECNEETFGQFREKSHDWKVEKATKRYFEVYDEKLVVFLNPHTCWHYFVRENNIKMIRFWIGVKYANDLETITQPQVAVNTNAILRELFKSWSIDFFEKVSQLPNEFMKNLIICDCLKYSLNDFSMSATDFLNNLAKANALTTLHKTESKDFYQKIKRQLIELLEKKNLWTIFGELFGDDQNQFQLNEKIVVGNYFILKNLSQIDSDVQLKQAIVNFHHTKQIHSPILKLASLLLDHKLISWDINDTALNEFYPIKNLRLIKNKETSNDVSLYQLLFNYKNLEISDVLGLKEEKNFKSAIMQPFGHHENISFIKYLHDGRPCLAARTFLIDTLQLFKRITKRSLTNAKNLSYFLCVTNSNNSLLVHAAVAFLELLGVNTNVVKLYLDMLKIIDEPDATQMFFDVDVNRKLILDRLENRLIDKLSLQQSCRLTDILLDWEIITVFCQQTSQEFPKSILRNFTASKYILFIIFVQYFNYPIESVAEMIDDLSASSSIGCNEKNVLSHLRHALTNDFQLTDNNDKLKRDYRRGYLMKVGVTASTSKRSRGSDSASVSTSASSSCSPSNMSASNHSGENRMETFYDTREIAFKSDWDFFQVVFYCAKFDHKNVALLKAAKFYNNPNFALVSTWYLSLSTTDIWLTWICASCCTIDHAWSIYDDKNLTQNNRIERILEICIQHKFIATIAESFKIFFVQNPLCLLTVFLNKLVKSPNQDCRNFLIGFKVSLQTLKADEMSHVDCDSMFEYDFICTLAPKLITGVLTYCLNSRYQQIKVLEMVRNELVNSDLHHVSLEYEHVLKVVKIIENINVTFNIQSFLTKCNSLDDVIDNLVAINEFDAAISLARLKPIQKSDAKPNQSHKIYSELVLKKIFHQFKLHLNKTNPVFWNEITSELTPDLCPELVLKFLQNLFNVAANDREKCLIIQLAMPFFEKYDKTNMDLQTMEVEMWTVFFALNQSHAIKFDARDFLKESHDELRQLAHCPSVNLAKHVNCESIRENLQIFIGELLDNNQIILAIRLEHLFNYHSDDLNILETCMILAEGLLSPNLITAERKQLINSAKKQSQWRSRTRSSRTWTWDTVTNKTAKSDVVDILTVLEDLIDCMSHGKSLASRILICYQISLITDMTYTQLVKTNVAALLKLTVASQFENKLELADNIITTHKWSANQISEFISSEMIASIAHHVLDKTNVHQIALWGWPLDTFMHKIMALCPDKSLLGTHLLSHAHAPLLSEKFDAQNLAAEILIRAHDCFTADCNMEGISKILCKVKDLANRVCSKDKGCKLLVRLLIAIRRFVEMQYIIDILIEKDQFETILSHETSKDTVLYRAIVEYLMQSQQHNDLIHMVALKWGMYDTAASLWIAEAKKIIKNVVCIARLEMENMARPRTRHGVIEINFKEAEPLLHSAMLLLTYAIQHLLLAEKYLSANKITALAQVVALQLSFKHKQINYVTCVLELNSQQFAHVVEQLVSFTEANILLEFYAFEIDWTHVLYHRVVVNNDCLYLDDYLQVFALSEVTVRDIVRRYLNEEKSAVNAKIPTSLKRMIECLSSASARYKLASELSVKDLLQTILESPIRSYFDDSVFKKGCRSMDCS